MRREHYARARAILGATCIALAASGACTSERERTPVQAERAPQTQQQTQQQQPGGTPPVEVDQVKEAPGQYYDKKVRVTGEVDELYSERAFKLEGTGWAFDDDITVLLKEPVPANLGRLSRDDELIVTGTVKRFTVADIERDVGWDLSPEIEVRLKERPVLVADMVRRVAGDGDRQQQERTQQQPGAEAAAVGTVAAIVLAQNPRSLAGQKVDLEGERIQAVTGKGMWVGPTAATQVFVVPATMPKDLAQGDRVKLVGTLREIPGNAQEMWGIPADTAGQLRDAAVYVEATTVEELPAERDERRH